MPSGVTIRSGKAQERRKVNAVLSIFITQEDKLIQVPHMVEGCWIHLMAPTVEELQQVRDHLPQIEPDFLTAALDEEERSRLETENGQTLIIVDTPYVEPYVHEEYATYGYGTIPLGIVVIGDYIVTVCLKDLPILRDFTEERVRGFFTFKKTRFILQILYRNASRFLMYLKQIDKSASRVEEQLHKSMKNKELIQMLKLEKSLVYFSTALNANEGVLEKLLRQEDIKKYHDDKELLEDVIVENKQAIEMCRIYREILSGTMDAFASVISNNLNIVMKILTVITILLSVPAVIAALWGMNVKVPFADSPIGFYLVAGFAVVATGGAAVWMFFRKMF